MDFIDLGLIHCCPGQYRGIHRQVHHHVTADGDQPGQGKQAVDEELMTPQKTRFWGVGGNGWFSGFHGLFSQNNGQPAACQGLTEVAAGQKNSIALCSIGIEAGLTRRWDRGGAGLGSGPGVGTGAKRAQSPLNRSPAQFLRRIAPS